jgi:hypothetical protein
LSNPSVYFSTPCHTGMVPIEYALGMEYMQEALRAVGIPWLNYPIVGESLITRARNLEVHRFLSSDCTHMFIWDSDQQLHPPEAIVELIKLDLPFVGIPVAQKYNINWGRIAKAAKAGVSEQLLERTGRNYNFAVLPGGIKIENNVGEIQRIGTGCILLKRETLEAMVDHYADDWFYYGKPDLAEHPIPRLFETRMTESREYLSEDFDFCEKWRSMGGKIYLYAGADVSHFGQFDARGDFAYFLKELMDRHGLDGSWVDVEGGLK